MAHQSRNFCAFLFFLWLLTCTDYLASTLVQKRHFFLNLISVVFRIKAWSLQNLFRDDRPKSAVLSENIVAVRKLILQDRYVTNRQTEAYLGIIVPLAYTQYFNSIWVANIFFAWIRRGLPSQNSGILKGYLSHFKFYKEFRSQLPYYYEDCY